MPLFLDLTPKIEARLQEEATAHGITVSELVTRMVEGLHTTGESEEEPASQGDRRWGETSQEVMEDIIIENVRRMKEHQIQNRELAVQVMTHKNNLEAEVAKVTHLIAEYDRKAGVALQSGNRELAKQFFKEKAIHEQMLPGLHRDLASATQAADHVKEGIKQEEERIRRRIAQALAMKSTLMQITIQLRIARAIDQFRLSEENEARWMQLQERLRSLAQQVEEIKAEISPLMDAENEDGQERVSEATEGIKSTLDRMQSQPERDLDVDRELADLEQRLRAFETYQETQMDVKAERELADLEQRLSGYQTNLKGDPQLQNPPDGGQSDEEIDAQLDILEHLLEIEDDTPEKDGEE